MQKLKWEWLWLKFLFDAVVLKIIDENINLLLMWCGHVNQLEPYTTV